MPDLTTIQWKIITPELILLGTILILLLAELTLPRTAAGKKRFYAPMIASLGLLITLYGLSQNTGMLGQILNDSFRLDGFALLFKWIILAGTLLVVILSMQRSADEGTERGEYYLLLLTAALGGMIMASSGDLITLFIGLELLSISSYILVGIRKGHIQSNEAAFKYVVNGGIATSLFLFGASYLYGLTGTTNLFQMAVQFAEPGFMQSFGLLVYAAFFILFVGLSFKISTVPFHMWTPDVYQGAPTTVSAFLSVVSKAAGFAMILRILFTFAIVSYQESEGFKNVLNEVMVYIAVLSALSMILGNIMAIRQINVKRMMAYSAIAQAGYLLVPLASLTNIMLDEVIFYLIAYLFMNLGLFAVIDAVTKERGTEEIRAFAGMYHRSPLLAVGTTILLFSLAGLPVTAGFSGKFYILLGALMTDRMIWLAVVFIITSLISYYYYFGIIRQMYMRPGQTEAPLTIPAAVGLVLFIGVAGTLIGGFFPGQVLHLIQDQFGSMNFFQIFEGKF